MRNENAERLRHQEEALMLKERERVALAERDSISEEERKKAERKLQRGRKERIITPDQLEREQKQREMQRESLASEVSRDLNLLGKRCLRRSGLAALMKALEQVQAHQEAINDRNNYNDDSDANEGNNKEQNRGDDGRYDCRSPCALKKVMQSTSEELLS